MDLVRIAGQEIGGDILGDGPGVEHLETSHDAGISLPDLAGFLEKGIAFFADADQRDFFAFSLISAQEFFSCFKYVCIKAAAESTIRSDDYNFDRLGLTDFHERKLAAFHVGGKIGHGLIEFFRVWPEILHLLLGTAQPGSRNHIHGAGNL